MLALMLAAALFAVDSRGPPPLLQPKTYTSPSGQWALLVDPTNRLGKGVGHYRLTRGEAPVWAAEMPYTFWDAGVDDRGYTAGYALEIDASHKTAGTVVLAIFAPDGKLVLEQRTEQGFSRGFNGSANPTPRGQFVQPELDRFVVRMYVEDGNESREEWWPYELSTGRVLEHVEPNSMLEGSDQKDWCRSARAVPGTPLAIVYWPHDTYSDEASEHGAHFALCDGDAKAVWKLDLLHDYEGIDDGNQRKLDLMRWAGAMAAPSRESRRFEVVRFADQSWVSYEVEPADARQSAWNVREVGRRPFAFPSTASSPAPPKIELRKLGSAPLGSGESKTLGPIHDVVAIAPGANGVRFVRKQGESECALVTVDERGELVAETRVAPIDAGAKARLSWWPLGESKWLASTAPFGEDAKSSAWRVDGESGEITALDRFDCYSVARIVPFADGGFVALATHRTKYQMPKVLARFDAEGAQVWQREQSVGYDRDDPSGFLSPEDIAVTRDGSIVVLDNIRHTLQTFHDDGEFAALLDLEQAWGKKPEYPTGVFVEPNGELLIHDFNASPSWWRMQLDGKVLAKYDLSRDDGSKEFGYSNTWRLAPDGALWNTDGRVLMHFDASGHLDRELGRKADPYELQEASKVFIDGLGRIAIVDGGTNALHVFGSAGKLLFVSAPEPDDMGEHNRSIDDLHADANGALLVQPSRYKGRIVKFGASGARLGIVQLGVESLALRPGTAEVWGSFDQGIDVLEVRHLAADGSVLDSIARRPDGKWLCDVEAVGVSAEGALAVIDRPRMMTSGDLGRVLAFYSPEGEPVRTIALDYEAAGAFQSHIVYGAHWIVLKSGKPGACLISTLDGSARCFTAPGIDEQSPWTVALSPDETELWLAQAKPPTLHRYALPAK